MKKNKQVIGLLALMLALSFVVVGCDNGTSPSAELETLDGFWLEDSWLPSAYEFSGSSYKYWLLYDEDDPGEADEEGTFTFGDGALTLYPRIIWGLESDWPVEEYLYTSSGSALSIWSADGTGTYTSRDDSLVLIKR
jgi:hypothetical protein